jgi:hypothetical protein
MLSAMDHNVTALERAFQIANSGKCSSTWDLRQQLKCEGYDLHKVVGRSLLRQLDLLIKAATVKNDA